MQPGGRRRGATAVSMAAILACSALLVGCDPQETLRCELTSIFDRYDPDVPQPDDAYTVTAMAETVPVDDPCDAADDAAIWMNEADPPASLIVATNKIRGLLVYALDGQIVSRLDSGRINNVDLRAGIPVGGAETIVVAATNRTTRTLDILALDAGSGELSPLGDPINPDFAADPYGICLYNSTSTGLYVFANDQDGAVGQWRLADDGRGGLAGEPVRDWTLGSQPEGCVADDINGWLYVGEEAVGIWRYEAEPNYTTEPVAVDSTGWGEPGGGNLVADVEGLALYAPPNRGTGDGYLVASSQGNNTYVVYDRAPPHRHRGTFRIAGGDAIDGAEGTDGIALAPGNFGPDYRVGLLVVQDGFNHDPDGTLRNQNFKLVSWLDVFFLLERQTASQ